MNCPIIVLSPVELRQLRQNEDMRGVVSAKLYYSFQAVQHPRLTKGCKWSKHDSGDDYERSKHNF